MMPNSLKAGTISLFYRQTAMMLSSGMPFAEVIKNMAYDNEIPKVGKMTTEINKEMEQGAPVEECLAKFPRLFSRNIVYILKHEQESKPLAAMFKMMADEVEKSDKFKADIIKVTIMPLATLLVAVFVMILLLIFVMPVVSSMYEGFGASLPLSTQVFLFTGNILAAHVPEILVFWAAVFFFCVLPFFKNLRYSIASKIPVVGRFIKKFFILKFIRCFAVMRSSNIPLEKALVGSSLDNMLYEDTITRLGDSVRDMAQVGETMRQDGIFPKLLIQTMRLGEKSGWPSEMMFELADYYEKEIDLFTAKFLAALNVSALVFAGLVVGWIVTAVYSPIFSMAGAIS